ncbi:MAG: molybdate ABC transporter substrate-binding protein [Gammaproteobacteria bacterium]|nr:molybdate ABC transporter substrate-binding protein [Gammaproteobacteria bacterium]
MRSLGRTLHALAIGAVLGAGSMPAPAQPEPSTLVFAAASTMAPLNELAQSFERKQGRPVRFSYAASSTLARQVVHGARADLFLSANRQWLDRLDRDGFLAAGSRRELTGNRLALIRPADGGADVILDRPATLLGALANFPLVLADPSHVPAGIYAREALEHLDLWEPLQGRLAFAANARAVTVRVARGEASLGITYASELRAETNLDAAALLPAESHSPIRYELALIEPADNPSARAFYEYLLSGEARRVFLKHGFTPGSEGKR